MINCSQCTAHIAKVVGGQKALCWEHRAGGGWLANTVMSHYSFLGQRNRMFCWGPNLFFCPSASSLHVSVLLFHRAMHEEGAPLHLLRVGSPGECSQCCILFSCFCKAVVACILLILIHLEISVGFTVGFLEVIETFSSIFLCLSLGTRCEGEMFLPTLITGFLGFRDSIAYFELHERTLSKPSPIK